MCVINYIPLITTIIMIISNICNYLYWGSAKRNTFPNLWKAEVIAGKHKRKYTLFWYFPKSPNNGITSSKPISYNFIK